MIEMVEAGLFDFSIGFAAGQINICVYVLIIKVFAVNKLVGAYVVVELAEEVLIFGVLQPQSL